MKPAIAFLSLIWLGASSALAAGPVCMDSQEMEAALIDWYQAVPVPGTADDDSQIWASEHTGIWALVGYQPGGTSCVLAQGDGWQPDNTDGEALALNDG